MQLIASGLQMGKALWISILSAIFTRHA